jgi:hypothetical protein
MTLRTCPGGSCERKTDCRRWLERSQHPAGEVFRIAPYALVRKQEPGRVQLEQQCDYFMGRE